VKICTLIVDDEPLARQKLRRYLADEPDVEIIGEADNGSSAVKMIESLRPDLILLDIQMPGLDGFQVVAALDQPPLVIFATAYDQYAIRAFEVNSLDYLLKPFTKARLGEALTRAKKWLDRPDDYAASIARLLASAGKKTFLEKLVIRERDKILLLDVHEALWIGSENSLNFIYTRNAKWLTDLTLQELEQKLDPACFFRIHRFAIVQINAIAEIIPWFHGDYRIVLKNPERTVLTLSRRRVQAFKQIFPW
jgi:two-component system LytT family response regulator